MDNIKKQILILKILFKVTLFLFIGMTILSLNKHEYVNFYLSIGFIIVNVLYQIQFYKDIKNVK